MTQPRLEEIRRRARRSVSAMKTRAALFAFALSLAILPCAAQETVLEILTVRHRPTGALD